MVLAAERVRSCLGPNGAYKMVTFNRGPEKVVRITRNTAWALEELAMDYPVVTVLSEAAKIHRKEVGDGVACFAVFAAALLKKANELVAKGVHPTVILEGYAEAEKKALEIIRASSQSLGENGFDSVLDVVDCGRGLLTSELRRQIVEAREIATSEGNLNMDKVRFIRKPGGNAYESRLVKGVVVKKGKLHPNMPDSEFNPRVAIISGRVGTNRLEVKMRGQGPFHLKFDVCDTADLGACRSQEKSRKAEALQRLAELDVNVLFSQQPFDSYSKSRLLEMGVLAFESLQRSELALLSEVTGAAVVCNPADMTALDVGSAETVEMDKIGLEKIATITCGDCATFLLRGSTSQVLDELELVIKNAFLLLQAAKKGGGVVAGAGAIEMHVARELRSFAKQFSGREQLAMECFAEALTEIPRCLAENNGLDSLSVMAELEKWHAESYADYGVGLEGCRRGVCVELADAKAAVLKRAYEVAALMLGIDQQIMWKEQVKVHKQL